MFDRLKTAREIQAAKSTGNMSVVPFLSLFTNCIVWTLYGALNRYALLSHATITGRFRSSPGSVSVVVCLQQYLLQRHAHPFMPFQRHDGDDSQLNRNPLWRLLYVHLRQIPPNQVGVDWLDVSANYSIHSVKFSVLLCFYNFCLIT